MSYVHAKNTNLWQLPEHALAYLAQADTIPHRAEGEAVLLEFLPPRVSRVLDLGTGDGRLLTLVRFVKPHVHGVALDFSEAMKSNKLLDVETQLSWLRELGFESVDCHWK